jgi:hypothetical protein
MRRCGTSLSALLLRSARSVPHNASSTRPHCGRVWSALSRPGERQIAPNAPRDTGTKNPEDSSSNRALEVAGIGGMDEPARHLSNALLDTPGIGKAGSLQWLCWDPYSALRNVEQGAREGS